MSTESHTKTVPLTWNYGRQIGTAVVTEKVDENGQVIRRVTIMDITDDQAARDLAGPGLLDHLSISSESRARDPHLCPERPLGESGVDS